MIVPLGHTAAVMQRQAIRRGDEGLREGGLEQVADRPSIPALSSWVEGAEYGNRRENSGATSDEFVPGVDSGRGPELGGLILRIAPPNCVTGKG